MFGIWSSGSQLQSMRRYLQSGQSSDLHPSHSMVILLNSFSVRSVIDLTRQCVHTSSSR